MTEKMKVLLPCRDHQDGGLSMSYIISSAITPNIEHLTSNPAFAVA